MKVTLIDYTDDPVNMIGQVAAICYDANTSRDANLRRAAHCKDKGHLSTLRFAYATFAIEGISRVCSHQLVRIAHAGILQESQRYVEQSNVDWVIPQAVFKLPDELYDEWKDILMRSAHLYSRAVEAGMKKEDARYILPQSCTTKINLCLNFRGWRDLLANRTSKTAQWEIRDLAVKIERQLQEIAPEIFG